MRLWGRGDFRLGVRQRVDVYTINLLSRHHGILPMPWIYLTPIILLCCSNVFMRFAWVRNGRPKADETVQWTVSRDERRELKRAAGELLKDLHQYRDPQ